MQFKKACFSLFCFLGVVFLGLSLKAPLTDIEKAERLDYALFKAARNAVDKKEDLERYSAATPEGQGLLRGAGHQDFEAYLERTSAQEMAALKKQYAIAPNVQAETFSYEQLTYIEWFCDLANGEKIVLYGPGKHNLPATWRLLKATGTAVPLENRANSMRERRLEMYEAIFGQLEEGLLEKLTTKLADFGVTVVGNPKTLRDLIDGLVFAVG